MRKLAPLITCFLILCGCTTNRYPALKKLATGLEQPWPGSYPLSMTMTVSEAGGDTFLHCRLQNRSSAALALDRSRLPWKQAEFFAGAFVTPTGRTFELPVSALAYPVGAPDPFVLGPNEVLEGDFEAKFLRWVSPKTPRNKDMLLLWSYNLLAYVETLPQKSSEHDRRQMPMHAVRLVGITFLSPQAMELLDK
jgi:hypothetical protein